MTIALYARRKGWPLKGVTVRLRHSRIHAVDCAECETKQGLLDRIESEIALDGALDEEQRTRALEIPWQLAHSLLLGCHDGGETTHAPVGEIDDQHRYRERDGDLQRMQPPPILGREKI